MPRESRPGENRVAAVPATVKTFKSWGWHTSVETGAGLRAGYPDDAYVEAGAEITGDAAEAAASDLVVLVGPPAPTSLDDIPAGSVVVGFLDPFVDRPLVQKLIEGRLTGLAMEAIPRTTLAQSMDALSSQANIAGYAGVLAGASASPKLLPMMVTAAGTIRPSKALILGVGVAGLQAIATARRLGAVVHAYDVRPETKEQVESLGAKFVDAPTTSTDDAGYATEVTNDVQAQQHETLAPYVADADIIITTAQIPGRPAPRLVTAEMLSAMRQGAVVIDMAAGTGGNVEGARPDAVVQYEGVSIHGPTNLASSLPYDASRMFARNIVALLQRVKGEDADLTLDLDDDIIGPTAVTHDGAARHPLTLQLLEAGRVAE